MSRNNHLPTTPCADCGQVHDRCGAHRKTDGAPCTKWPETGARVCRAHGGGSPAVKKAAAKRVAEERLKRRLADYWSDAEAATPAEAYQRALAVVDGNVRALPQVIADLPEDQIGEALEWANGVAALAAKVANDGIKAGIADRAVKVTEEQHRLLGEAIAGGMADIGLGDRVPDLLAAIGARLTAAGVEQGTAVPDCADGS